MFAAHNKTLKIVTAFGLHWTFCSYAAKCLLAFRYASNDEAMH